MKNSEMKERLKRIGNKCELPPEIAAEIMAANAQFNREFRQMESPAERQELSAERRRLDSEIEHLEFEGVSIIGAGVMILATVLVLFVVQLLR